MNTAYIFMQMQSTRGMLPSETISFITILTARIFRLSARIILSVLILFIADQQLLSQKYDADSADFIDMIERDRDSIPRNQDSNYFRQQWNMLQQQTVDSLFLVEPRNRFSKQLRSILFRSSPDSSYERSADNSMVSQSNKIIGYIKFRNVDMFSASVDDNREITSTRLERTVNKLHLSTRQKVLSRYLLLDIGDTLNVHLIAENERLLRNQPFIMDARFIADTYENEDTTGLILYTQDLFPIGFEAELASSSSGNFGLWHNNVLGFGHQLKASAYWDSQHQPQVGYGLVYRMPNIRGTYAAANLEYLHKWNQQTYLVNITRGFRSSSFKYAGGALFEKTVVQRDFELLDSTLTGISLRYSNLDIWAGRFVKLRSNQLPVTHSGMFFTTRFNRFLSSTDPGFAADVLYNYRTRNLLLFSTGYTKQGFKKDHLIYTFGRTEDVPFGYLLELISGVEWGLYSRRYYLSAEASYGTYFKNSSYLYAMLNVSTFVNKGNYEQGMAALQVKFFTRLHQLGGFNYRRFVSLKYINGLNRLPGDFITIADKEGIRGLKGSALKGLDKLSVNMETIVFSPFRLVGFRFAFFGFTDIGLIARDHTIFEDPQFLAGVGAGVRIRNDQLVFNTFVIRLGIYPGMPVNSEGKYLMVGGLQKIQFSNFFPRRPKISDYR